jgi:hypothetical protein
MPYRRFQEDPTPATLAAAKAAIAGLPRAPGLADRVKLTLAIVLDRELAERLAARAIADDKDLEQLLTEIVEAAAGS